MRNPRGHKPLGCADFIPQALKRSLALEQGFLHTSATNRAVRHREGAPLSATALKAPMGKARYSVPSMRFCAFHSDCSANYFGNVKAQSTNDLRCLVASEFVARRPICREPVLDQLPDTFIAIACSKSAIATDPRGAALGQFVRR